MTGIERLRELAGGLLQNKNLWNFTTPGYDKAHGLSKKNNGGPLYGLLGNIADQIEIEHVSRIRVMAVLSDMERHVSGVEGAEDSPVARWARELRDALKSDASDGPDWEKPSCAGCHGAADVTSDAQEVTREDSDAIAWVRDHGGLERVRRHWDGYVPAEWLDRVKRSCERKRDRLKGHAWELERKCAERRERIRELERKLSEAVSAHLASDAALYDLRREVRDLCEAHGIEPGEDPLQAMGEALDRRLMPDGMEWPHDAKGVPIVRGETVWANGSDSGDGRAWHVSRVCPGSAYPVDAKDARGERRDLKPRWLTHERPAPKVLDADGVEIRVGDTVWHVETGEQCKVVEVDSRSVSVDFRVGGDGAKHTGSILPANLTHRAPVLAADGKPLREGETVWHKQTGRAATVKGFDRLLGEPCAVIDFAGIEQRVRGKLLTHERPDSWERLEEDAEKDPCGYFGFDGEETCGKCPASGKNCEQTMARDIVRRAKALAERERSE